MGQLELLHESDWNILVILDAMRYDYFERFNTIPGKLQQVYSGASCTINWLKRNFPDKYPYVYVSTNPTCNKSVWVNGFKGEDHFKDVVDVWKDGWDESMLTVLPHVMTVYSVPYLVEEKVILHYMQPHSPYLNFTDECGWILEGSHVRLVGEGWYRSVPIERYIEGYEHNVMLILEEMHKLLEFIPDNQKVVISTDHGQMLGEHRVRGHPCNTSLKDLVDVPWFEVEQ